MAPKKVRDLGWFLGAIAVLATALPVLVNLVAAVFSFAQLIPEYLPSLHTWETWQAEVDHLRSRIRWPRHEVTPPEPPPEPPRPPEQIAAEGDIDLLDGRLWIHLPGAVPAPPRGDVMSASTSPDLETRVWNRTEDQRMIVVFQELLQISSGDLEGIAEAHAQSLYHEYHRLHFLPVELRSPGLEAVARIGTPSAASACRDPVATVFVRSPDGSIQRGDWYVDPNAVVGDCSDIDAGDQSLGNRSSRCERLAEGALRTLRVGYRPTLVAPAGRHPIRGVPLSADMPPGWLVYVEVGVDFRVVRIEPLPTEGEIDRSVGIYAGTAPHDLPAGSLPPVPGTILGESNTWTMGTEQTSGGRLFYTAAQLLNLNPSETFKLHVFASGTSPEALHQVMTIADSLRRL